MEDKIRSFVGKIILPDMWEIKKGNLKGNIDDTGCHMGCGRHLAGFYGDLGGGAFRMSCPAGQGA